MATGGTAIDPTVEKLGGKRFHVFLLHLTKMIYPSSMDFSGSNVKGGIGSI